MQVGHGQHGITLLHAAAVGGGVAGCGALALDPCLRKDDGDDVSQSSPSSFQTLGERQARLTSETLRSGIQSHTRDVCSYVRCNPGFRTPRFVYQALPDAHLGSGMTGFRVIASREASEA